MNVSIPIPVAASAEPADARVRRVKEALGRRSIVLVGMMGAGKSSIGRRLAGRLGLPFLDADMEIERAAGMSIPEIFERHGESAFRDGERRVISRLLDGGPCVLATGGGAYMNPDTRTRIAEKGVAVWLKAEFDVLMRRVRKRSNRPLLRTPDPEATLRGLISTRYPVYAGATITLESRDVPHETMVEEALRALDELVAASGAEPRQPPAPTVSTVRVDLGPRGYDIVIGRGVLAEAGRRLAALAPGGRVAVVTDSHLAERHLPAFTAMLRAVGLTVTEIVVPPGEPSKSFATLQHVCDGIVEARIERRDLVVAFGGGVIGDLAGFAASIVRRGVRFAQVPTTLLAQVDSSVGGKTGINTAAGKNLVGAFYQPALVLADTALLDTLPAREFRAGYAEVVKYGLLGDATFFDWLEANWKAVLDGGHERDHAVAVSCRAKAAIVARDEREDGERALLNLGHTFGHALERITGYDSARLVHGEAVAIGMAQAFRFAQRLGHVAGQDTVRVERHLAAVGLPTALAALPGGAPRADEMLDAMAQDKKVSRGELTFILVRGIGKAFIARNVPAATLRDFLLADGAAA